MAEAADVEEEDGDEEETRSIRWLSSDSVFFGSVEDDDGDDDEDVFETICGASGILFWKLLVLEW